MEIPKCKPCVVNSSNACILFTHIHVVRAAVPPDADIYNSLVEALDSLSRTEIEDELAGLSSRFRIVLIQPTCLDVDV